MAQRGERNNEGKSAVENAGEIKMDEWKTKNERHEGYDTDMVQRREEAGCHSRWHEGVDMYILGTPMCHWLTEAVGCGD